MHTGVMQIPVGAKDVTLQVKMYDPADNGTLEPALTVTDFDLYYIRVEKDNDVTISAKADLTALSALTDAHTDNKALEIGQGYYRVDIPDAAFAAGATRGSIILADDGAAALTTTIDFELIGSIHEWHVAKSGLDAHGGHSFEDALLTIGQAVTNAADGDKIIIHTGDYDELVDIVSATKSLFLKGEGPKVRIKPLSMAVGPGALELYDDCIVEDISIMTPVGSTSSHLYRGLEVRGDRCRIRRCDIFGAYGGLLAFTVSDLLVEDCHISSQYNALNHDQSRRSLFVNTTFYAFGTIWTLAPCRAAMIESYSSDLDIISFVNCHFYAERNDASAKDLAAIYVRGTGLNMSTFDNCTIGLNGGTNFTGNAYGLKLSNVSPVESGGIISLNNCVIDTTAPNATTGPFDFVVDLYGRLSLCNVDYDVAKVSGSGVISQVSPGWAAAVNAEADAALSDYDPPTRGEATTDKAAIITEVQIVKDVNVTSISGDSGAADNLELQYDGTGLIGDTYPYTQAEGAALGGGLAINTTMASVTAIKGSEQNLSNASTSDDSRWTGDDDGSGAEFIFRCTPADTSNIPVEIMFEGYYDEPTGATNGATLQVYNFNTAMWDTIATLTNSSKDEDHEVPLSHAHKAPGSGTLESVAYTIGDVLIKFFQDTTETGNACLLIDLMLVGFVGSLVTASEIVDEWETQSQANPTNFHVNAKKVDGNTPMTSADVNTQMDNALDTAIPGSPTAHSINERLAAVDDLVEASGSGDLAAVKADVSVSGLKKAGYVGDYKENGAIYFFWHTSVATSTDGTVKVYKDDGTSEVTAPTGITDGRDFDSKTGVHLCKIDLSASSFYARGKDYSVVLSGVVIAGSTVNVVIATFGIENRYQGLRFRKGG